MPNMFDMGAVNTVALLKSSIMRSRTERAPDDNDVGGAEKSNADSVGANFLLLPPLLMFPMAGKSDVVGATCATFLCCFWFHCSWLPQIHLPQYMFAWNRRRGQGNCQAANLTADFDSNKTTESESRELGPLAVDTCAPDDAATKLAP